MSYHRLVELTTNVRFPPLFFFLSIIVLSCRTNRSTKQTHPNRAAADADVYDDKVSVNRSIRILRS